MDSDEDLHNFIGVTLLYNILIQSCIVMVSIQQKMGREKISSMNEQRHSYHRVYIFNCLQNSGFQLERILWEQCVLL